MNLPRKRALDRQTFLATSATALTTALIASPALGAQFDWKCGDGVTLSLPMNVRLNEAFAKIRDETKGQLDIRLYPNSSLGADASLVSQIRLGAVEMLAEGGNLFDSMIPFGGIDGVPFGFPNYAAAYRAFDGSLGALVRNEFYAKGLFAFERVYDSGFRQMTTSTSPIRIADDLQGVKLRVPLSKFRFDIFRSLGSAPTALAYADVYTALQTHLVDGEENPLAGIEDQKYYEVQKYCSMTNHMWGAFWILVNRDKWESLPRNFQEVMRKHINAAALVQRSDMIALDKSVRSRLSRFGLLFNDVDAGSFRAKLKASGFYARWRAEWGQGVWSELEKYTGPLA